MGEITNRTLFITMIIIAIITILVILTRASGGYYSYSTLPGSVYQANVYDGLNNQKLVVRNSGVYVPSLYTNYQVTPFRTSTTRSIRTTTLEPSNTYYYTTYQSSPSLPDESGYYGADGYVPAGCEGGTDYSVTTGEPCG